MSDGTPCQNGPSDERIIVRVDIDIEELIPEYLELTRADVKRLLAALDAGEYDTVGRIGHSLKGSGGGYGFDAISEIGGKIEQQAKSGSQGDLVFLAGELGSYLDRVEIVFE